MVQRSLRWKRVNAVVFTWGPVPLAHRPSTSTFSNTSAAHLWRHQHDGHETDPGQEKKSEHERLRAVGMARSPANVSETREKRMHARRLAEAHARTARWVRVPRRKRP